MFNDQLDENIKEHKGDMHLITNHFLFIKDELFLVVNDPLYVFMQMHNMLIYCDRYTCK